MNDGVVAFMGVAGITVVLADGWVNNIGQWVSSKAAGSAYSGGASTGSLWPWVLGLGVVTGVLVAVDDAGAPGLATAGAGLVALVTLLKRGGDAYANLQTLFSGSAGTSTGTSGGSPLLVPPARPGSPEEPTSEPPPEEPPLEVSPLPNVAQTITTTPEVPTLSAPQPLTLGAGGALGELESLVGSLSIP